VRVTTKWYETFFEGIVLDMWRVAMPPEHTRAEIDFLVRELGLAAGAAVLDVPCGLGRHALELAQRGMKMTGVDLSREAIEEARAAAASGHLAAEFVRADMRELPWEGAFDAAYCFGNSFGYLGPEGSRAFLAAVSRTLKPGARFALDAGMAAEAMLPHVRDREWMEFGDILFLEENHYDANESALETRYTFVRGGQRDTRVGIHSVFTVREIRGMLREVGLIPTAVYGTLASAPYEAAGRAVYLIARKNGIVA